MAFCQTGTSRLQSAKSRLSGRDLEHEQGIFEEVRNDVRWKESCKEVFHARELL